MEANKAKTVQWRIPALIGAVVLGVHAVIIGGVLLSSGCGTTKPQKVEAPPAPILPPTTEPAPLAVKPIITPPVAIEPAPTMKEPLEAKTYVVQPGDSLDRIARRFGVSSRELMELNGIKNANALRANKKLVLPPYAKEGASKPAVAHKAPTKKTPAKSVTAPAGGATYEVKSGDSLARIAKRQGIKISALRAANQISGDRIRVGQKLVIPGKAEGAALAVPTVAVTNEPAPVMPFPTTPAVPTVALDYTVKDGETLDDVAKLFLVKKEDILKANDITDPATVQAGRRLKIP